MIVIDIKAQTHKAVRPVQQLERSLDRLERQLERIAASIANVGHAAVGPAARSGRKSVASPQLAAHMYWSAWNKASGGRYAAQANSSAVAAYNHFSGLAAQGDIGALRLMARLAPAVARATKPPPSRMAQLIGTTRLNLGAASPLVSRLLPLLGSAAGPVALAVGTVAGLKSFVDAVTAAASRMREFATAIDEAGTTAASFGALTRLGRFTGAPGAAAAFGERISGGGIAGAYAAGAGISIVGGPFGDFDYGAKYLKYARFVASAKDRREAQRRALAAGVPELAALHDLTPEQRERALARSGLDDGQRRAGTRLAFELSDLADKFEKLKLGVLSTFMPLFERYSRAVGMAMKSMAWLAEQVARVAEFFLRFQLSFLNILAWLEEALGRGRNSQTAQDRNTRAVEENTRAMKDFRETLGGGSRASSVIPARVGGLRLADPAYREALTTGVL